MKRPLGAAPFALILFGVAVACDTGDPEGASLLAEGSDVNDVTQSDDCERVMVTSADGALAASVCKEQEERTRHVIERMPRESSHEVVTDPPSEELATRVPVRPEFCEWYRASNDAFNLWVTCPSGKHVVSGGCRSLLDKAITASTPFEDGNPMNQPEDNDAFNSVWGDNGWYCQRHFTPGENGQTTVFALCCDDNA